MTIRVDRCPACSDPNPVPVAVLDDDRKARYLEYSKIKYAGLLDGWLEQIELVIDSCSVCGHHWYREHPDEDMLSVMYATGRPLRPQIGEPDRNATSAMIWEMQRLRKISGKVNPALLDYGSGFGRWARAGVAAGFQVTAFEPSLKRGAEFDNVDFTFEHEFDKLLGQQFDTINLEQVLEHVSNPIVVLRGITKFCAKGAFVRITVPNILRCPEGNKLWGEWPFNGTRAHTMAPFEHLHGFTPHSLRSLIARAGFTTVSGFYMCWIYPKEMGRILIGRLYPRLGQTWIIAKVE